jgi:hypothetical protein
VVAARRDPAVQEVLVAGPLRPADHRAARPRRPVGIEDPEAEPVGVQLPLRARQRPRGPCAQERLRNAVAGQPRAGEVVLARVAQVDGDGGRVLADVLEPGPVELRPVAGLGLGSPRK